MPTNIQKTLKLRTVETIQKPSVAGPTRTQLPITEVIRKLVLRLSGTMTEGGTADGTLTPEGMASLLRNIEIVGTSSSRSQVGKIKSADFAAFVTLQKFLKGFGGSYLAPTPITKSSAASPFNLTCSIDFELPYSQDPRQTLLNTQELTSLYLNCDWGDASDVMSSGSWTFPSCSLEVAVSEFVDDNAKAQRYGLNQFSYIEVPTTSSNTRLSIDLKRGNLLRGFLIKQFTRNAVYYHTPVTTVINSVSLELNREVKEKATFAMLQAMNMERYQMASVPTGYAFMDMMPEALYDTLVNTNEMRDCNVILDVNGVANSFVRIYPVEIIPSM
jgi:hypothetical protein